MQRAPIGALCMTPDREAHGLVLLRPDGWNWTTVDSLDMMRARISPLGLRVDCPGGIQGRKPANGARGRNTEALHCSAAGRPASNSGNQP
jgi:hypothetical protein